MLVSRFRCSNPRKSVWSLEKHHVVPVESHTKSGKVVQSRGKSISSREISPWSRVHSASAFCGIYHSDHSLWRTPPHENLSWLSFPPTSRFSSAMSPARLPFPSFMVSFFVQYEANLGEEASCGLVGFSVCLVGIWALLGSWNPNSPFVLFDP